MFQHELNAFLPGVPGTDLAGERFRADQASERPHEPVHPDDPGALTPRQIDVLRLLARGQSNADIATALNLSEHTVHRHVANIYNALGLGSRAAAAAYAALRGIL